MAESEKSNEKDRSEKTEQLNLEQLELEVEMARNFNVSDKRTVEQEIIRRNLEVCNALLKTLTFIEDKPLKKKVIAKVEEHLDKLSA